MYSACVGAATEDAGFTDMDGNFAEAAANCMFHYGITAGTGGGMYSPNAGLQRWQMAIFLTKAAGPAGIDTMMVEDQMLGDISDLSEVAQDAINTVASLGIMAPRSDGVFDPSGIVTRSDMAVHLVGFLSEALQGPGSTSIDKLQRDDLGVATVAVHRHQRSLCQRP